MLHHSGPFLQCSSFYLNDVDEDWWVFWVGAMFHDMKLSKSVTSQITHLICTVILYIELSPQDHPLQTWPLQASGKIRSVKGMLLRIFTWLAYSIILHKCKKKRSVVEDFLESIMDNVPFQGAAWGVGSKAVLFYIPPRLSNKLVRELCSLSREEELSLKQPILKK